mmetsp:Transcript_24255/g.18449  ORF Transcript_24255/g.18449 Transcript_24255/m.18449 type:complete len:117 (+) Transcript_24255:377-727(+)
MMPYILFAPHKVTMLVNLGSICILMSFGALKGFYAYFVNELIFGDKKLYSIGYILSLAASTYASLIIKNYLLTIACLAIEVVFMLYFICSSFPYGQSGLSFLFRMVVSGVRKCLRI